GQIRRLARTVHARWILLGAEPAGSGQPARYGLADLRRPAPARDARAALGESKNLLAGAAFAHHPHHQQCLDRGRRQQRLHRALEVPHGGIPPRGAAAVRRHRLPSLGAGRRAHSDCLKTREPAQLRRATRRHRRPVLTRSPPSPREAGTHIPESGGYGSPLARGRQRLSGWLGLADHSGPAYVPAVAGNIALTILSFEMSTVASMCRKMAASRKIFSTPKSSITPLPPCSSRQCCATFKISSEAKSLTMLQSVSASGALSSTACAARSSSARTASMRVAMSARRSAAAWCLMRMRPPCT